LSIRFFPSKTRGPFELWLLISTRACVTPSMRSPVCVVYLHRCNVDNELYKMSPISNIYSFSNILPSQDPHVIDKSPANLFGTKIHPTTLSSVKKI
jgi:hypothetical protein